MKIMLDCSPAKIAAYRDRYDEDFWQLRTPLTEYARADVPYGLDNGCYKKFLFDKWRRLLIEARDDAPKFVCLPDIVGDAARTLELFEYFMPLTEGLPRALVLQDGIDNHRIPWSDIAAVFVGGSDNFKHSNAAVACAKAARVLGKWVHVGRVNTAARVSNWMTLADSFDGSGISQYDHMLSDVLRAMRSPPMQLQIEASP